MQATDTLFSLDGRLCACLSVLYKLMCDMLSLNHYYYYYL